MALNDIFSRTYYLLLLLVVGIMAHNYEVFLNGIVG